MILQVLVVATGEQKRGQGLPFTSEESARKRRRTQQTWRSRDYRSRANRPETIAMAVPQDIRRNPPQSILCGSDLKPGEAKNSFEIGVSIRCTMTIPPRILLRLLPTCIQGLRLVGSPAGCVRSWRIRFEKSRSPTLGKHGLVKKGG